MAPFGYRRSVEEEGRALVQRLGGRWGADGGMCRCPAHDDRTPSLSVRPGRRRLLLHCFAGCDSSAVLRALKSRGLLEVAPGKRDEPTRGAADGHRLAAARRIWCEARSLGGTPAASYLKSRALETDSPELRFHPRTPLGQQPLTRYRPALIAAVRDQSGLVAIQRTFIDPKRNRLHRRCGLGRFGSGAVRLGGAGPRLGLAEGIETALSATALFGVPCWAVLGTERFRLAGLPAGVRELLLFLDHDEGGRRAERLARAAFAHVPRIEVHVPDRPGDDWNDILMASSR